MGIGAAFVVNERAYPFNTNTLRVWLLKQEESDMAVCSPSKPHFAVSGQNKSQEGKADNNKPYQTDEAVNQTFPPSTCADAGECIVAQLIGTLTTANSWDVKVVCIFLDHPLHTELRGIGAYRFPHYLYPSPRDIVAISAVE